MEIKNINLNNIDDVWSEINRLDRVYIRLTARRYSGFEGEMIDADIAAVKEQMNELWAAFDRLKHEDGPYCEADDPTTTIIEMENEFNEKEV